MSVSDLRMRRHGSTDSRRGAVGLANVEALTLRLPGPRQRLWLHRVSVLLVCISAWLLVMGIPGLESVLPYRIDLDVYRAGALAVSTGSDLYGPLPGLDLVFTYPPFAGIVFQPLGWVPYPVASVVVSGLSVAALALTVRICVRELGWSWGSAGFLLLLASMWLFPVRQTFGYGQINILLMALIVIDLFIGRGRRWQGLLLGVAISIKLTPLVFLGYFLVKRQWKPLVLAVGAFVGSQLVALLVMPHDFTRFWAQALFETGRVGDQFITTNQSLTGLLHRIPVTSSTVWLVVSAVVIVWGLMLARALVRQGEDLAAASVVGLIGLLISPISWTHHWVWCIPALMVCATWYRQQASPRKLILLVIGAAIFLIHPSQFVWFEPPMTYLWWQHPVGSAMTCWTFAFFIEGTIHVANPHTSRPGGKPGALTTISADKEPQ